MGCEGWGLGSYVYFRLISRPWGGGGVEPSGSQYYIPEVIFSIDSELTFWPAWGFTKMRILASMSLTY